MKISQMIIDFASDYIHLGKTNEEKQNYLNAACVAWNISILPKNIRKKALSDFLATYKKNNPYKNINDIKNDMKLLIKEKVRMFPNVKIGISHATITETDNEYRIIATSVKLGQEHVFSA